MADDYQTGREPSRVIPQRESAGDELDRRIKDLRRTLPDLSYEAAMGQILAALPALKARFAAEVRSDYPGSQM